MNTQEKMERNLVLLKWTKIFYSIVFVQPVLILLYGLKGLSLTEFFYCQMALSMTVFVMEIPAGYLSDRWERKSMYTIGAIAFLTSNTGLYFADSFYQLLWVAVFLGMGFAFSRGSFGAILYDTLITLDREDEHTKQFGKMEAYDRYSLGVTAISSGFLYNMGSDLPMILEIVACVFCLIFTVFLIEPKRQKIESKAIKLDVLWKVCKDALYYHKDLKWVILAGSMIAAASTKAYWVMQPTVQELALPIVYLGFASALSSFLIGIFSQMTHKFNEKLTSKNLLGVSIVLTCLSYVFSGLNNNLIGLLILSFSFVAFGISQIITQTMINERVDSDTRATALSVMGSMVNLMFTAVTFVFALSLKAFDLQTSLLIMAGIIAAVCVPAWLLITKKPIFEEID